MISNRSSFRMSIGTKFLVLISVILAVTFCAILFNATSMFKRDNLDSVSLSSDLLTSAKASQAKTWVDGILSRSEILIKNLEKNVLNARHEDSEILFIELSEISSSGSRKLIRSWINQALLKKEGFVFGKGERFVIPQSIKFVARGKESIEVLPWFDSKSKKQFLVLQVNLKSGYPASYIANVGVSSSRVSEFFSSTGPYVLALLNSKGQLLAHKDPQELKNPNSMEAVPIVKRMMVSSVDREVTEFEIDGVSYLGGYVKLGAAGLGVINLVSREIALETGNTLVRRSLIIAGLVFCLAFITVYFLIEGIVSPVKMLREAAIEISEGDYAQKVQVKSRDEIADLASSFNVMGDEISRRIHLLARINQAALHMRRLTHPQDLLNYSLELIQSLFDFHSFMGFFVDLSRPDNPEKFQGERSWKDHKYTEGLEDVLQDLKDPMVDGKHLVCPILQKSEVRGCLLFSGGSTVEKLQGEGLSNVQTLMSIVSAEFENITFARELQNINAELEERVKARTKDLAMANEELQKKSDEILERKRELDDVMSNIQEGILTFDSSAAINPEYSSYALELFSKESLAGLDLIELLCPPSAGPETEARGEDLRDWIKSVFAAPEDWEMLQDFGVKELELKGTEESEHKDLKFEWRPIYQGDQIQKMMLVCVDITEKKRLEAEISKKEAEHTEQLEIIAQLINHSQSVVEQFVSDFSRNLNKGLEILQKGVDGFGKEAAVDLMRALHTIKGAAKQFNLGSVQKRAGDLESSLAPVIDSPLQESEKIEFFENLHSEFIVLEETLRTMLALYEKVVHSGGSGGEGPMMDSKGGGMIPIPINKVDTLFGRVLVGKKPIPPLLVRKAVNWLLKKPVKTLFDRLESLAQSLAPELEREVQVSRQGDELEVDFRILSLLYDALLHVVRNSLDHGGETPEERQERGLPAQMTLNFTAKSLESGEIHIQISDDGKGVNVEAVKQRVLDKKLYDPEKLETLTPHQIAQFVFFPGFSTRDNVSDVSGRGVGMEVLKHVIEKDLGGRVVLETTPGKGTQIDMFFSPDALIASATPVDQKLIDQKQTDANPKASG